MTVVPYKKRLKEIMSRWITWQEIKAIALAICEDARCDGGESAISGRLTRALV
jgi:hypothetical protein